MSDLTLQQFCAELAVSESTVRRWRKDGLPYTPVGVRAKRYNLETARAWLKETQGCPSGLTKTADATSASWPGANEFTESFRKVQLRVMPSNSMPS